MPTYKFIFPSSPAGLAIAFTGDYSGSATTTSNGVYLLTVDDSDLDENSHIRGRVESTVYGTFEFVGQYQTQDSIEAGGGGGSPTADTAFLLATGTVAADGSNHNLSLAFDGRFPEVDWLTVAGDTATIPDGAGSCVTGLIAGGSIDFTGASATPDTPGLIDWNGSLAINGSNTTAGGSDEIVANGDTVQNFTPKGPAFTNDPVNFGVGDEVRIPVSVSAYTDDAYEDQVTGAHATFTVAVAITRGGSAPTLP